MAIKSLRSKFNIVTVVAGLLVTFFGVIILTSGIVIIDILKYEPFFYGIDKISCQFWAGIPTILTGFVLLVDVFVKTRCRAWRYISICYVLLTMVVTLGVIMEESSKAVGFNYPLKDFYCKEREELSDVPAISAKRKKNCIRVKEVVPWYYILIFTSDVVLVLCVFVLLVLFVDWLLFATKQAPYYQQVETDNMAESHPEYEDGRAGITASAVRRQQTWNVQRPQHAVPRHTDI